MMEIICGSLGIILFLMFGLMFLRACMVAERRQKAEQEIESK